MQIIVCAMALVGCAAVSTDTKAVSTTTICEKTKENKNYGNQSQ